MVMFLGHIAFLLATFAVAGGLALLQLSGKKGLFALSSWILIVVGALGWLCIGYYMWYYHSIGAFMSAHPQMQQMMMGH